MSRRKKVWCVVGFVLLALGACVWAYSVHDRQRIALVDIEYSKMLAPFEDEVVAEAGSIAKMAGVSRPVVIGRIYDFSRYDVIFGRDEPMLKMNRQALYLFTRLSYIYLKPFNTTPSFKERNCDTWVESRVCQVFEIMPNIARSFLSGKTFAQLNEAEFMAIFERMIALQEVTASMHKEYFSGVDMLDALKLFSLHNLYFKAEDAELMYFIFQILAQTKDYNVANNDLERLGDLVYEANNIEAGRNNAYAPLYKEPAYKAYVPVSLINKAYFKEDRSGDYLNKEYLVYIPSVPENQVYFKLSDSKYAKQNARYIKPEEATLAVVLDANGIKISDFLGKNDVEKAVFLWNLAAKSNSSAK